MEAKFLDIGGSKTLRLAARESAEAAIEGALPLPGWRPQQQPHTTDG